MTSRLNRCLFLLALAALLVYGVRTISHPEAWSHLARGQAIWRHGLLPAPNGAWLYDLLIFFGWSLGGGALVTLVHVALAGFVFFVMGSHCARQYGCMAAAAGLLVSSLLLSFGFEVGPMLFSLLFPALFFVILDAWQENRRDMIMLVALQMLWTNIHPSFWLGPCMVWLTALRARYVDTANTDRMQTARRLASLGALLLAATLVNPWFVHLHIQLPRLWRHGPAPFFDDHISPIAEFAAHHLHAICAVSVVLPLLLNLTARRGKWPWLTAWAFLASCLGALVRLNWMPYLALLGLPFVSFGWQTLGRITEQRITSSFGKKTLGLLTRLTMLALVFITFCDVISNHYFVLTGSLSRRGLGVEQNATVHGALGVIDKKSFPANFFSMPQDGGFLNWRLPRQHRFSDHSIAYMRPGQVAMIEQALNGDSRAWDQATVDMDGALLHCTRPEVCRLIVRVTHDHAWQLVYFDGISAVLVRDKLAYTNLIHDSHWKEVSLAALEQAGSMCEAKLKTHLHPPIPVHLLGAGYLFALGAHPGRAVALFELVVQAAPRLSLGWYGMGLSFRQSRRKYHARTWLEKAHDMQPKKIADLEQRLMRP